MENEPIKVDDKRHTAMDAPVPIEQDGDQFLATIERLSAQPNIPVEKIEQIMNMQFRVLDREAKQAFNAAMTRAQSKIELVVAESENTQTKSNYAKLESILISAKPFYTEAGFSLMFYEGESPKETQKRVCVDIMHSGGHTEKRHGDFTIQTTGIAGKAMMTQIHGEGSAFSYGRRYLTCMIFNIPTGDDDDGNAAGNGKMSKFEEWEIKATEACGGAQGLNDIIQWWPDNSAAIKKELNKADAAKIYNMYVDRKNELKAEEKAEEREPGAEG